ncbi:MAG TPA: nitrite reductase [Terriglobales bacterium]|nr:nitrite reductase [Terriglobales bacterium]
MAQTQPPLHETKVQRHERIKAEQNPWEELPRLFQAFRAGHGAIAAADLTVRLRWWGLYTQGDGEGAFGAAAPYFMLRVRVPSGLLDAAQVRAVARIAERHGRGLADITVRQNFQLHWLEAEHLPDIFHQLWAVGLTSQAACGDDTRNVTGCPLSGIDPEAFCEAGPIAAAVSRALISSPEYYNLPRKFKICVTGCRQWCPNPEINDVAFTAHRRGDRLGFGLRVGGGLSSTPLLAVPLPVFVAADQVVPVARAIVSLFRDRAELRQNRAKARLKFLFLEHGWTAARFLDEIESRLGFALERAEPDAPPAGDFRDHVGIHPQLQPGLFYAGVSVLRGRLSAAQLHAVADAAERWGSGSIRATAMQNLVVADIPERHLAPLERALAAAGLPLAASSFRRGVISCTGKEFCKLAVTETKQAAAALVAGLERRLPGFAVPIKINLNGCPNSCGQHWIADIGLQGVRVKTAGGPEDGFDVFLGGALGRDAGLSRKTLGRVRAAELADRLAALLRFFAAERQGDEPFHAFVRRTEPARLAAVLGQLPAVALPPLPSREDLISLEAV